MSHIWKKTVVVCCLFGFFVFIHPSKIFQQHFSYIAHCTKRFMQKYVECINIPRKILYHHKKDSLSVCLSLPVSSSKYFRDHLQSVANSAINYNKCTNWIYISSNYSNACAAEFIASSGEWNKCLPFLSLCFHSLSHLFALLIPNSERVVINHVDFLTNGCTKDNENIYKKTTVFQQHQRINAEKYHYPTHIEFL